MQKVLAVGCHPDDIEFMMGGTLCLLAETGCIIHYMNLADGSCGSMTTPPRKTAAIRSREARQAAEKLKAIYHRSLAKDLEVFYCDKLLRRLTAVIREADPQIILLPPLQDYMEDHMITARLTITAAFQRSVPNYKSKPPRPICTADIALYHCMPYGLLDSYGREIKPDFFIDVSAYMHRKTELLACHASQQNWLSQSQGINSYMEKMTGMTADMGKKSGRAEYAEGWTRHNHIGYAKEKSFDPLLEITKVRKLCSS